MVFIQASFASHVSFNEQKNCRIFYNIKFNCPTSSDICFIAKSGWDT